MSQTETFKANAPQFYLYLIGFKADGVEYRFNLGPWDSIDGAVAYSDGLTDSRIGEQLLNKLGVTELHVYEA